MLQGTLLEDYDSPDLLEILQLFHHEKSEEYTWAWLQIFAWNTFKTLPSDQDFDFHKGIGQFHSTD